MGAPGVIFEPWMIYTYNRCPILFHLGKDSSPSFGRILHSTMVDLAKICVQDYQNPPTVNFVLDTWNKAWTLQGKPPYTRKRFDELTNSGTRIILAYNTWLATLSKPHTGFPIEAGGYRMIPLAPDLYAKVPIDLVTSKGTLYTFSVTGSGLRENLFYSAYAISQKWADMIWDGPHIVLDPLIHCKTIAKLKAKKEDAAYKIRLTEYLKGIKAAAEQEIIVGRKTQGCQECTTCDGLWYRHRSR